MEIDSASDKPIFLQIAEGIEEAILSGAFAEEQQIPSITEFSVRYTINPATALKGINLLVDEGVLYKRRGVGMFVKAGAAAALRGKHSGNFRRDFVQPMVAEAMRLAIPQPQVLAMTQETFAALGPQG